MPVPGDGSDESAAANQDQDRLRYAMGTAAAATPAPTPSTAPHEPPPRTDTSADPAGRPSAADEPSIRFAQPVDPWAEAEAAARAAGSPPPYSMAPPTAATTAGAAWPPATPARGGGGPSYRKSFWIFGGAAAAATVALAVAAGYLFWPGFRALDFHDLEDVARLDPAVPITSGWADTAVRGDRAYFAGTSESGEAVVTAYNLAAGKEIWKSTEAGTARAWSRLWALPEAAVLLSEPDYTTSTARLVVLDGRTGAVRWEKTLDSSDDTVRFASDIVLVEDHHAKTLRGYALTTGDERWHADDPDGTTQSGLITVTVPDDLDGPSGTLGSVAAPDLSDKDRVVQVFSDRSARVIDAHDGRIGASRPDVAYGSDAMVAHDGRLFVEESSSHRLLAYDLTSFGGEEPQLLYTAKKDGTVTGLAPCGDDRICFIETVSYAYEKSEVVAADLQQHKEAWRRTTPKVKALIPVGDAVLAVGDESNTLYDADGKPEWEGVPGAAARLDGGNVLRFSDEPSASVGDRYLEGVHLGDKKAPIGALQDVRSSSCSWNTSVVACVGEKDFVIKRFAG
ncbi:PQQ-binding-like beta-propeller repeat protein [Actinoplanes oblitus]|uniref:PQQ-binding-like beta-propeller repeat protein n=1 Tax=Actinoplanes oblitus TaxID=3040509 RepID=A0ABY8WIK7_9ACTN|nr:PQQ-binding-like beta-propeller repeat protein [Actinoplanes oblitus]WIM96179.1 PQQ-binding-like beta-propeller repeat protein [Actinoplanes oblitus]